MPKIEGYLTSPGGGGGGTAGQLTEISFYTAEAISGGRAVAFTTSGTVQIAMCMQSGRMPAIGYVRDNYASGARATVYRDGRLFNTESGSPFNFSGLIGFPVFVGQSGHAIASGAPIFSGAYVQTIGVSIYESGMLIQLGDTFEESFVVSGDIASGGVVSFNVASGTVVPGARNVAPFVSGNLLSGQTPLITAEIISGGRAVNITRSGTLQIAMASVSGRMPAIGYVHDGVLSGIEVNVYTQGFFEATSGLQDFSGYLGRNLWVGRSGLLTQISGSWGSGGWLSGDLGQIVGTVLRSGSLLFNLRGCVYSGGPAGSPEFGLGLL